MRLLLVVIIFSFQNAAPPSKPSTPSKNTSVQATPNCCTCQSGSYDAKQDTLYRAYLLATILGVIAGGFGIRALWLQTKATERAAVANKLSVDTLINVERPWIQVKVSQPNGRSPTHLLFEMVNIGKTPAQIISHAVRRERRQSCDDLPIPPDYGRFETIEIANLLPPNDPRRMTSFTISDEPKGPEAQQYMPFIFYGIVRYKNVISDGVAPHETRFCFAYVPHDYAVPWPCGPEEYNRTT